MTSRWKTSVLDQVRSTRWVRVLTTVMYLCAVSACAQTQMPVPIPQIRDPGPEDKQKVVLRLEKHRTCDTCPWYEVRIFEHGATLFWGKEAVSFLGVDGSYMLPNGGRPDMAEMVAALMGSARHIFNATESLAIDTRNQQALLQRGRGTNRQAIVIDLNNGNQRRTRGFVQGESAELEKLASEIERLYKIELYAEHIGRSMSPGPAVFENREVVLHWRTFGGTSDQCSQARGFDELNITVFSDARFQAEARRHFWKSARQNESYSTARGYLDKSLVDTFRKFLIVERTPYVNHVWTPLSAVRNLGLNWDEYGMLRIQRQRILYLRKNDGRFLELTVPYWDESERRIPSWSKLLGGLAEKITEHIWREFPPPDQDLVAECRRRPPGK